MKIKSVRRNLQLHLLRLMGRSVNDFRPHGVPVYLPPTVDIALRYRLALGRSYEQAEAEMIDAFLAPGTNVIELGGCLGVISALIRRKIGPNARHVIVEANAATLDVCEQNASREAEHGATRVLHAAIDYSGAKMITFAKGDNPHVGHIAGAGEDGEVVPTVTLRALTQLLPDGPFALVSDVEGAEIGMFAAETEVLKRVTLMVLETHPLRYRAGAEDLAEMLRQIEAAGLREVMRSQDVICFQR